MRETCPHDARCSRGVHIREHGAYDEEMEFVEWCNVGEEHLQSLPKPKRKSTKGEWRDKAGEAKAHTEPSKKTGPPGDEGWVAATSKANAEQPEWINKVVAAIRLAAQHNTLLTAREVWLLLDHPRREMRGITSSAWTRAMRSGYIEDTRYSIHIKHFETRDGEFIPKNRPAPIYRSLIASPVAATPGDLADFLVGRKL